MKLENLTAGQEFLIRHQANKQQAKADRITAFRKKYAPALGAVIALTRPTWLTTAAAGYFWKTDYDDGKYAKDAQAKMAKVTGRIEPLSDGHIEDPKADKRWFWAQTGGLLVRSITEKDYKSTAVLGSVSAITIWRDAKMARTRRFVEDEQLDISLAAINANRAKTALQATSETVLMSPLASKHEGVKNASLAGLAIGTLLGVYGMEKYRSQVNDAWQAKQAEMAALCPDKVRFDTNTEHMPNTEAA